MPAPDLDPTFQALKGILEPLAPSLVTVHDGADHFYLDTAHLQANRKPLFFGAVRTGRKYVSFHLMPVYLWPELLDGISDGLRARMQGKSCFNFRAPDPELLAELEALVREGFGRYQGAGYV